MRKELVDMGIFLRPRNGERKPCNLLQLVDFHKNKEVEPIKSLQKIFSEVIQGFKRSSKWRANCPAYMSLYLMLLIQVSKRTTSPEMITVFHLRSDGGFTEITHCLRRKKLHRMNQGFNFLRIGFNWDKDKVTT